MKPTVPNRKHIWLILPVLLLALPAALLLASCSSTTTITERVTRIVVHTVEAPEITVEVTRLVTREVTRAVTILAGDPETIIVTVTPLPPPDRLGQAAAYQAAIRWLVEQQQQDGRFGSPRATAWAVVALHAAGLDPETVTRPNGRNAFAYLDQVIADNLVARADTAALIGLAYRAAGRDIPPGLRLDAPPYPSRWPDLPLLAIALEADTPDPVRDALRETALDDVQQAAWALMAWAALDMTDQMETPLALLRDRQQPDDAWSMFEETPDPLTTALVIQALMAAEVDMAAWGHPERALLALQDEDGSFDGDPETTAAAVIALSESWLGAGPD